VPLDFYDSLLDRRLAALRADFFPCLPAAGGKPLAIELGCGHGHYLTAYAGARPEEFCIGLDLLADRIARAERKAKRAGLTNLAFVQAEASLFLSALAAWPQRAPVRRIFVLFSDPWPKRRHWKHRVMQTELLDTLANLTETGASVHFRTDHPGYFTYAREVVAAHGAWGLAPQEEAPWPFEYVSVFEERALAGVPQSFTALRK
jgi:tRNA (guanine-N7-)-methyltransferase